MAAEDKLFKLQNLERTKQLINDISFTKAVELPKAAGGETLTPLKASSSQSFLLRRTQALVNRHDMSAIEPHIKIFSEFDPANPYYSSLLNRINHGEHISWKEFEDAVSRFSSQEYYLTKLQDEINNTKINASLEGVPEEELEKPPPEIAETPTPNSEPPESDNKPETSHTEPSLPHLETEAYERPQIIQRRPLPQKTPEQQAELKQRLKASQAPKTESVAESKPTVVNKLPQRNPALSSKTRKKAIPKTASGKVGQKVGTAAALGSGGGAAGSGVLGNVLGARSLLQAGQWLANKLGLRSLGNLLGKLMPEKLIAQSLRGLWNLGSGFGRAAFDGLVRNAFTWAPRAAFGGAGSTIGGWLAGAGATAGVILTSAMFWFIMAFISLFVFTWWYDQLIGNSECDKPTGEMRIVKRQGGIGSLEIDPSKIEAAVPNGEKIDFIIEASYQLACRTRTLSSVIVTDRIPEGTTYIPGSAKSGFYSTANTGPDGVYDEATRTLTWTFKDFPMSNPVFIYFSAQPNEKTIDTWVMNEARVTYTEGGRPGVGGAGTISVQSASLQAVIDQAAQRVGMEPALMKAFLRVEAQAVLNYSEEEFKFFSTPGWWEGLVDNAATRDGNDPTIVRGYGYNTCAYTGCAAGADVRGVAQFEIRTWEGIAKQLSFDDGHAVDRRIATDAIFGSALLNRENAEYYTGTSDFEWTEEVIRAAGRIYCGGKSAARKKLTDGACMAGGKQYEDLLWGFYLEYSGK